MSVCKSDAAMTGKLYDPETELICGLRPTHFVTFATPHLGCDGDRSAAQVVSSAAYLRRLCCSTPLLARAVCKELLGKHFAFDEWVQWSGALHLLDWRHSSGWVVR